MHLKKKKSSIDKGKLIFILKEVRVYCKKKIFLFIDTSLVLLIVSFFDLFDFFLKLKMYDQYTI